MSYNSGVSFKLFFILATALASTHSYAFVPPASLPIEPASPDEEVIQDGEPVEIDIERPEPLPPAQLYKKLPADGGPRRASAASELGVPAPATERRASRTILSSEPGEGDFSAQARMGMSASGFAGHIKLVQYPRSWLGITETFRYFKNEEDDRAFHNRRGFLIGIEVHPWRNSFISPFLDTQLGWESFERVRDNKAQSIVVEAAAGLELRLTHFATLVAQWTEAYYPDLKEQLFYPEQTDKDPRRYAAGEVLFNLKWETKLF